MFKITSYTTDKIVLGHKHDVTKQKKNTNPEIYKKFTINKECSRVFQDHLFDNIWETNQ